MQPSEEDIPNVGQRTPSPTTRMCTAPARNASEGLAGSDLNGQRVLKGTTGTHEDTDGGMKGPGVAE